MDKENLFRLGHITKPFGLKGEMFFYAEVGLSDVKKKFTEVFWEENGALVSRKVKKFEFRNKSFVISIEGVDDRTKAEEMHKKAIFVSKDFMPSLKKNEFYYHEIAGWKVIDKNLGEVGIAEKIIDYPLQKILVVKKDKIEILIPLNDNFLTFFNREKKFLEVDAPEGLIDLYLNPPKNFKE